MRKAVSLILVFCILLSVQIEAAATVTKRKGKGVERLLWDELSKHSPSDYVTAAVLSYFWRESQYQSDAVSGAATMKAEMGYDLCGWVKKKADKGLKDGSSRDFFLKTVRECGGYGLGQWHSLVYLRDLYDFAAEKETSIASAEMQCEFVFHSLKQDKKLWKRLKRCKNAEWAGRLIAVFYDGSRDGADYIGQKAERLFEKYGGKT